MISAYKKNFADRIEKLFQSSIQKIKAATPEKNIFYELNLTRSNSLSGSIIVIKQLDGEQISLSFTLKKNDFGDLTLRYDVYETIYDRFTNEQTGKWLQDEIVETIQIDINNNTVNEIYNDHLTNFIHFVDANLIIFSQA